jgi:hypothetical protein
MLCMWIVNDLYLLEAIAKYGHGRRVLPIDKLDPKVLDSYPELPHRAVEKGCVTGAKAARKMFAELYFVRLAYAGITRRIEEEWVRVREFRPVLWGGDHWASGHGAILSLAEEVLAEAPQPTSGEDERSLRALRAYLRRALAGGDLSPLVVAAEQEHAAIAAPEGGWARLLAEHGFEQFDREAAERMWARLLAEHGLANGALDAGQPRPGKPPGPDGSQSGPQQVRPRWDEQQRTLYFGEVLCRKFGKHAPDQETLLAAFEEAGWPELLRNAPLEGDSLACVIKRLNDYLEDKDAPLRFKRGGVKKSACWYAET